MGEPGELKQKVAKGLLWGALNNGSQQILGLFIGIFLARLLTPADYGMIGVLTVFSAIAGALQEGGFITALINRREYDPEDYNSVFWFTTCCGLSLYLILFFCAPLIADFYELPELVPLSRYLFLSFLFSSTAIAARAKLIRNMRVKDIAITSILSLAISGSIGIFMAFNGNAYWGLATQTVVCTFFIAIFSFYFSHWHPFLHFTLQPLKEMIGYGSKIIVTNIFNVLNNNVFSVLLGKFYSPSAVGDYNQAAKWNSMGYSLISGMIGSVAHPALARVVDDTARQVQVFRKMLRFTAFVSFPAMFGLALVAKEFIVIALGEKWLFSASILQLLCIWGAFVPISQLFTNLILSHGRSNIYMWLTISMACVQILAVYFSYPYGLFRMVYVYIGISICWIYVWYHFANRQIPLGLGCVLKDVMPFMVIALASVFGAHFATLHIENIYIDIVIKGTIAVSIYATALWLLDAKIMKESLHFIKTRQV